MKAGSNMKSTKPKKALLLVPFLAAALALTLIGSLFLHGPARDSRAARTLFGGDDPARLELSIRNQGTIGEEFKSRLQLSNHGRFQFGQGSQSIKQEVESQFAADLSEVVVASEGSDSLTFMAFAAPTLTLKINGQVDESLQNEMLKDMSKGLLIRRTADGLVKDLRPAPDVSDFSRDMLYSIAKAIQYSLPEGQVVGGWTASEEDAVGVYQASYRLLSHQGEHWEIERERAFYHKLNAEITGDLGHPSLEGIPSGKTMLVYDASESLLRSINGLEKIQYLDENRQEIGMNEQTIAWTWTGRQTIATDQLNNLKELVLLRMNSTESYAALKAAAAERQTRSIFETRLGNDSFEDLLQKFAHAETLDGQSHEQALNELLLKLRAFIYLHPAELSAWPDALSRYSPESDTFQTFAAALVNISNPEAQAALIELAQKMRGDPKAMEVLIPSLGFVKDPEIGIEATLKDLAQDDDASTRNMADLSLGIMGSQLAKSLRDDDGLSGERHKRMNELEQTLLEAAQKAKSADEWTHQLDIIGNLASPAALAFIRQGLSHAEPKVRAVAATALRDIDTPESLGLIQNVMQNEKEADVRLSAAEALGNFKVRAEILALEEEMLNRDQETRVRIQLLQNIARARFLDPISVQRIIEKAAERDVHEHVRNYAQSLLSSLS